MAGFYKTAACSVLKQMESGGMLTPFFLIEPDYSDPDTYCFITVSNGCCKGSMAIYLEMGVLLGVVNALRDNDAGGTYSSRTFDLADKDVTNIGFDVFSLGSKKILRTTLVNTYDETLSFRCEIDIPLTLEESTEFAEDLNQWVKNPAYQFIWKK